jgi:anti-sigma-K factor RskA
VSTATFSFLSTSDFADCELATHVQSALEKDNDHQTNLTALVERWEERLQAADKRYQRDSVASLSRMSDSSRLHAQEDVIQDLRSVGRAAQQSSQQYACIWLIEAATEQTSRVEMEHQRQLSEYAAQLSEHQTQLALSHAS